MNAYLNLAKAVLALAVRNILDWLRFLSLETSAFLAQIYFFDLIVFSLLASLYDFSVLVFFHLNFLSRLPDYLALNFCFLSLLRLLDLLPKLFVA